MSQEIPNEETDIIAAWDYWVKRRHELMTEYRKRRESQSITELNNSKLAEQFRECNARLKKMRVKRMLAEKERGNVLPGA